MKGQLTFNVNFVSIFNLGERQRWSVGQLFLLGSGLDYFVLPLTFNFHHFGLRGGKGLLDCNSLFCGSLGIFPNQGDFILDIFRLGWKDFLNVSRGFWYGVQLLFVLLPDPPGARRSGLLLKEVLKRHCVCKANKHLLDSRK